MSESTPSFWKIPCFGQQVFVVVNTGYGLLCSQIVGKHACGHVPAFIGGDGYEQVGFSHSHFFQAFYGGRGGCSRHQVEVGVQCAQLLFVVVHQNDVLLLAGQQFGQVCAYCAGTCNNYFHFLYGNEE